MLKPLYRDVRELEREGKIIRRHGELLLKKEEEKQVQEIDVCACCSHCGLLLFKELQGNEVQSCMTRDFISGNPINCFSLWWSSL